MHVQQLHFYEYFLILSLLYYWLYVVSYNPANLLELIMFKRGLLHAFAYKDYMYLSAAGAVV